MSVDVLQRFPQDGIIKPLDECHHLHDVEASFSVKLFPDGFAIGNPLEQGKSIPPPLGAMDLMYPYNRTSESFLRALDGGWIPGGLLDDIHCKYVDGCVVCEIHDYCANAPDTQSSLLTKLPDWSPVIYKITLKPTMESIVKDVSSMMDDNWTYADLMEIESRILKTVKPELNLDPKPSSSQSDNKSLLRSSQRIFKHYRSKGALIDRRLRNATSAKAMVRASSLVNSKKISFEAVPERVSGETTSDSVASKSYQSLGPIGPATQTTQSLLSPGSNMPLTMAGFEPVGLGGDSKLFNPGKRDARDYGVRVDMTKIKQEPIGLDKQSQSAVKFDRKLGTEPGVPSENTSELIKLELQYQKEVNPEQQRLGDPMSLEQDLDLSSQRLIQQSLEKPQNLSWQVLSPAGDRDNRQDDLLHRKKSMLSPKINSRSPIQSMSSDVSHLSQGAVHNLPSVVGSSPNPNIVTSLSSGLAQQKEKLQMQAALGASGPLDPIMQQLSRRRTSSLPKNPTNVTGVASPSSTGNSGGMGNINSPSTASIPPTAVKNEAMLVTGQRKEPGDNFGALLSIAQRHGLPAKRRKVEQLPEVKKTSPSWQLLLVALANTSTEDINIPKGQRNMADSLAGGNVNVRKTRFLRFQRQVFHGTGFRRVHVRLVMCERGKDVMVEAVVQFGDDQDDETLNSVPHHVLPTMPNAHAADRFARQFCTLMEKEGFELIDDQVHPTMQRNQQTNPASNARSLPAAASTLGNNLSQLSSPRAMMNQHMPTLGTVSNLAGMPQMQPAAQNGLAANHMPPPGNAANRQISAGYLGQAGNNPSSKPLQLDGTASQLTGLQHPQHQQALSQRAQQMLLPTQLSQLSRNPGQQINPQMVANTGQLQQYLQQQHRQQAHTVLQRKFVGMGGLGTMGSLGGVGIPVSGANQGGLGNVVGMNNVVGMGGMNNVSASMAGISSLNSVGHMTGLNTGLSNLIGQQLRPGTLTPAQMAALSSKAHLTQGQSGHPVGATNTTGRNSVESLTGMNMANQVHMSAGLPLSRVGRVGLTPMQRAPVTSMGSPKVATSSVASVAAQNMYLNSQQLNLQQQVNSLQQNPQQALGIQQSQLTSQQVNAQMQQQQQQNPQQQLNLQQQQQQPPKTSQQLLNPQASLITQSQQQQQINSQGQINPVTQQINSPLSQQLVGGLGSIVGGPASPQLSSQSLGSVTGASMEASTASHGASLPSSGQ